MNYSCFVSAGWFSIPHFPLKDGHITKKQATYLTRTLEVSCLYQGASDFSSVFLIQNTSFSTCFLLRYFTARFYAQNSLKQWQSFLWLEVRSSLYYMSNFSQYYLHTGELQYYGIKAFHQGKQAVERGNDHFSAYNVASNYKWFRNKNRIKNFWF